MAGDTGGDSVVTAHIHPSGDAMSRTASLASAAVVGAALLAVTPAPASAQAQVCDGKVATIVGTAGNDMLTGTSGDDVIVGLAGDDIIRGGGGDDTICGGDGADGLYGDAGNDRVFGQRDQFHDEDDSDSWWEGDYLHGGPGDDRLDAGLGRRAGYEVAGETYSWRYSATPVTIDVATSTATGEGSDTYVRPATDPASFDDDAVAFELSAGNDRFVGDDRDQWVEAGNGNDTVITGAGDDYAHLGAGDDIVGSGGGSDSITAGRGSDTIGTGAGPDIVDVDGTEGDLVRLGSGRDHATITNPSNLLDIGAGKGARGESLEVRRIDPDDRLVWRMTSGSFKVKGSAGRSRIKGFRVATVQRATWRIVGTPDRDKVYAERKATVRFLGRAGRDAFVGGKGDDFFHGGADSDRIVYDVGGRLTCVSVELGDPQRECDVLR